MIKHLDKKSTELMMTYKIEDAIFAEKSDLKKDLLDLSIKYGILSKETAFYCKSSEPNKEIKLNAVQKVAIPAISRNYDHSQKLAKINKIVQDMNYMT